MRQLSAQTSPLIVPLNGKGSTRIDWDSGSPNVRVQIFERLTVAGVTSPWGPRPLVDPAVKDHYTITLRPGEVYEAMMFPADLFIDPNMVRTEEANPLEKVRVFALLNRPSTVITDGALPDQQDVGGTYYARKIATGSMPTWATMQIGKTPPVADGAGLLQIPVPLEIIQKPLAVIHDFEATPTRGYVTNSTARGTGLDPGNLYFAVVLAYDAAGNWEQHSYAFTTLRQTIALFWKDVKTTGSGFGHLGVTVYEGRSEVDYWWRRGNFTDGQTINMLGTSVYQTGPRIVDEDNRVISVELRGIRFRSYPSDNDIAKSIFGPDTIKIPVGRGRETVINREDIKYADPVNHDNLFSKDFSYQITVLVEISYNP